MRVSILGRSSNRLADLLPCLESAPSERERTQRLPPRLDQVQVRCVLRLEDELPARVCERKQRIAVAGRSNTNDHHPSTRIKSHHPVLHHTGCRVRPFARSALLSPSRTIFAPLGGRVTAPRHSVSGGAGTAVALRPRTRVLAASPGRMPFGPIGVVELADRVGRDYTTVSRRVAKLESLGLVKRRADATDKRIREAVVTAAGRRMTDAIDRARGRVMSSVFEDWSAEDLETLATLLRRLVDTALVSSDRRLRRRGDRPPGNAPREVSAPAAVLEDPQRTLSAASSRSARVGRLGSAELGDDGGGFLFLALLDHRGMAALHGTASENAEWFPAGGRSDAAP